MTAPTVTFDSNILVYANDLRADGLKRQVAQTVMQRAGLEGFGLLTVQALGEFAAVARRKAMLPTHQVAERIDNWRAVFPVAGAEAEDVSAAIELVDRHRLQVWDAIMLATASRRGLRWLVTEDMQDGAVLAGVTVLNPFAEKNIAILQEIGLS